MVDKFAFRAPGQDSQPLVVDLSFDGEHVRLRLGDRTLEARLVGEKPGEGLLEVDGRLFPFYTALQEDTVHVWLKGRVYVLERLLPGGTRSARKNTAGPPERSQLESGDIQAPMPGKILQVKVKAGDRVKADQTLVVLESMKMEMSLNAPYAGIVAELRVEERQMVEMGALLLRLQPVVRK